MLQIGLLDAPVPALESPLIQHVGSADDIAAVVQAAVESTVLLKNSIITTASSNSNSSTTANSHTAALPLSMQAGAKLLVVGASCDSIAYQAGGEPLLYYLLYYQCY
jgi:hypothetical protein